MHIIWYILWLLLITSHGALSLYIVQKKYKFLWAEFLSLSFMVWLIELGIIALFVARLGLNRDLRLIVWLQVILSGILAFFIHKEKGRKNRPIKKTERSQINKRNITKKIIWLILVIRLLIKLTLWAINIYSVPTYQDDTTSNWNYRAKARYYQNNIILDETDENYMWWWYKQYPITPSFTKTYLSKRNWSRNEWLINSISFIFYIISLTLLFSFIYHYTKKIDWWLWGVLALSSIPIYHIHWTNPYFDVFMATYFLAASRFVFQRIKNKEDFVLALIMIATLWYTKSEGLIIFSIAILLSYALYHGANVFKKENFHNALKIWFGWLVIQLPLIIFKKMHDLWFWNGNIGIEETINDLVIHNEIRKPFANALYQMGNYWPVMAIATIAIIRGLYETTKNKKPQRFFYITTITALALIMLIYLTTFTYQYVIDQTGINRSMVQILTMLVFCSVIFSFEKVNWWNK